MGRSAVRIVGALIAGAAGGAAWARRSARKYFPGRRPELPFSEAVLAGSTLYLAGQIGLDETGQVPDDPADEARRVMDGVKGALARAGMAMDDLVFVQIYCSDLTQYGTFNAVYRTYFTELPARAFLGSGKLLFEARFEVQGIAVRR